MFTELKRPSTATGWKMSFASINTSSMASLRAQHSKTGSRLRVTKSEDSRAALLEAAGITPEKPHAVFVTFSESSEGRGLDLMFAALDRLLAHDVRLILAGPVDSKNITALEICGAKTSEAVCPCARSRGRFCSKGPGRR